MTRSEEKYMGFIDHLSELRWAIIRSMAAIAVGFAASLIVIRPLMDFLRAPLKVAARDLPGSEVILRTLSVTESFTAIINVSFFVGFCTATPYLLFELWKFVSPGLKVTEKKWVLPIITFGTLLFALGIAFSYSMVLPNALRYFIKLNIFLGFLAEWRIHEYLYFVLLLLFVFGIMFELPLLSVLLARLGIISGPFLLQNARYGIVLSFLAGAVLTPPDLLSQFLLAVPVIFLYGISIILAYIFGKKNDVY